MITQTFDLNMIPDSAPVVIHCDQYDHVEDRLIAKLFKGDVAYTPAAGATAIVQGRKPDGKGFTYSVSSISGNTVTFDLTEQMSAVAGRVKCQLVITENFDRTGTFAFDLDVQRSALPANTDMSTSEYEYVEELIETAESINIHPPIIGQNGNWYVWDTNTKAYVDSGVDASITVAIADITMLAPDATPYVTNTGTNTDPIFHLFIPRGKGVSSITKTGTSGLVDTYTITYSDGYTTTFTVTNGKGISSITKTGTSGLVDTYTITYNDNTTTTFTVTNGKTAYQSAVEGGYTGTESDFYSDLANFAVYATNAQNSASDAEAYAIGKRGGVDVGNSDPAYHNNAKYWAEQSAGQTFAGLQDVDIDDSTLADGQVPIWNGTDEKWENGTISSGGSIITVTTTTEQGNAVSMVIDNVTYSGTFSAQGVCQFEGVKEVGTATFTSGTLSETLLIEYYGNYTVDVSEPPIIYGAEWDGTSTTLWSRTDMASNFSDPVPYVNGATSYNSPFDNILPWSGMVKEERTGGTMVKIPKFWYKLTQNGVGLKIQISPAEQDGFSVSPAHMDRGDGNGERDYVYVGRYHCSSADYKSKTGQSPKASVTRSAARTAIHNLDSKIWQMDFATRFTIWLLYIVEFADWNSQAKIGYGCGNNSSAQAMGYTDSMPYHTGTTQSSRTTYGLGTQYRYIEGLWDNVYDWCDGCYYNGSGLNIILNPSNFSDSSGGIAVGTPTSGYPSAFSVKDVTNTFPLFIPSASNGDENTYSCDYWDFNSSRPCLCVGGSYSQSGYHGLFFVYYASTTNSYAYLGCRIMELP